MFVTRLRIHQAVAAAASATLLGLAMFGGAAQAANTRLIYIGDPALAPDNASGIPELGTLTNSLTAPGGLTAVDILVKNYGVQTVNHASLLGGEVADARPDNANFPPPATLSLPLGYTYVATFPESACDISDASRSVSCDIGTLVGGASFQVRVVIATTSPAATSETYWFGAYLAEGNATGTNQDNFFASDPSLSSASTCAATGNYFLPDTAISLGNVDVCGQTQSAQLNSGLKLDENGQGGFALVAVDDTFAGVVPKGFTKFGTTISADVIDGALVPGGLQWTVRWFGTTKLTAVIHFLDGGGFLVIPFKNNACVGDEDTNCVVSTNSTKPNATPTWFEAVFVTPDNGKVGGLF